MKKIREMLVDLYGCRGNLDDAEFLASLLKRAAEKMGSRTVKTAAHKFSPTGITVITILCETHMAIHTWPEYDYAALDIFICSEEIDPEVGWETIRQELNPSTFQMSKLERRIV
jgi:S-adenosylmethionine decarboxylase proenzyme